MKDYSVNNPRREPGASIKRLFVLLFMFLIAGGLVWLFVFSAVFEIKEISVRGEKILIREDLIKAADEFAGGEIFGVKTKNLLLFRADGLEKRLKDYFPRLKKVVVEKEYFHKLSVTVSEREIAGVWCGADSNCFYFDDEGVAFEEAPFSAGSLILSVKNLEGKNGQLGEETVATGDLAAMKALTDLFYQNIGVGIFSFLIFPRGEIRAETSEGWTVYYIKNTEPKFIVDAVSELLRRDKSIDRAALEYIDLRIEGKVFYK